MALGLAVRNIYPETNPTVEPQLQLLVEREPGYRIFFRNFLDVVLRRKEPPLFLSSQPVHFRKHFHVRTGVHWMVILESIVWHTAAVPLLLVLWTWSLSWEVRHYAVPRNHMTASQQEIYYPLAQAFPAREGRQHEEAISERSQPRERALRVAKERRHENVEAPDVPVNGRANTEIASSNPTLPAVPLSATARPKLVLPGDLAEAIGPAPDGGQLAMRGVSGLAASVVAPPPQVTRAGRGGMLSASATVVAPAPALQGSLGSRKMGSGEIGSVGAVAPIPSLAVSQQRAGRGAGTGTLASSGVAVVPPAPSVRGSVYHAGGSGDLVAGTGAQVVAPSPSLGHALVLAGGHGNSLAGSGEQVVPPTPSIRGRAYLAGNGGTAIGGPGANVVAPSPTLGNALAGGHGGRRSALGAGTGTSVVPPAPSIVGSGGHGGGGGRIQSFGDGNGSVIAPMPAVGMMAVRGGMGGNGAGSLNGNGEQIVGPAPSLGGTGFGSSGTGMGDGGKSLVASLGTQAVAPPGMGSGGLGTGMGSGNGPGGASSPGASGSVQGGGLGGGSVSGSTGGDTKVAGLEPSTLAGNGGGGTSGAAPIISSAIPSHAEIPDIPAGKTEVVPLRVIQLALALPMSSYFSNYEAFIAERSVNRNTQLIKLVYIFLPYQRRLTEFEIKPAKTFNLRVTRDPSCDESLLSMTWPEGERGQPPAEQAKDKLPCYRTTADDYRRAWEKAR